MNKDLWKPIPYAEEVVFEGADENSFAADYSLAFLNQVNWHEIAAHLNES